MQTLILKMKIENMLMDFAKGKDILPITDLVQDLGIDGDDADELFDEISAKFNVDLSDFQLRRYFHSEGELVDFWYSFKWLAYKLKLSENPPVRDLEPYTVADLKLLISHREQLPE